MIDTTNPAGRLYTLLEKSVAMDDNSTMRAVWLNVFSFDKHVNDFELLKNIMALHELSQECQTLIEGLEIKNKPLYLSPFENVDKAIMRTNLDQRWKDGRNLLAGEVLTKLQFCAEALSEHYAEEWLDESDIDNLIEDVAELFETIKRSNLSKEGRRLLLEELARIQHAIQHYRISGARGLKAALQGVYGAVIVNQELISEDAKKSPELFHQIGSVLDTLNKFTTTALKSQQIGYDVLKLIGPFMGGG